MSHTTGGRHRRPNLVAAPDHSASGILVPTPRSSGAGSTEALLTKTRPPKAKAPISGGLWRLRPRTVRARIVALLAVPVIALMALWGLATVTEVRGAYAEQQVAALDKPVRGTMAGAQTALEQERTAAVRLLTQPAAQPGAFTASISATDTALAAVRTGTAAAAVPIAALAPDLRARVQAALSAFGTLPDLRRQVTAHGVAAADVYAAYDAAIDAARAVGDRLAQAEAADAPSTGTEAAAVLGLLAVVISLPVSVRVGRGLVVELVGLRDDALDLAGRRLPEAIARLRAGDTVDIEQAAPLPAGTGRFVGGDYRDGGDGSGVRIGVGVGVGGGGGAVAGADHGVAGGVGGRAVVDAGVVGRAAASGGVASRAVASAGGGVAAGAVGRATARGGIAGRARSGAAVAGESEAGAGGWPAGGFDDEIGQVAAALAVVQRAALVAAVERAEMVSGVARIFLNLARRSQILVHRQLALLDAMERRVMDPAEVEDLFRLDHLATRMRRHAESLIILSGQAPGRGWRLPVPLLDVLRSAVAEVEDFARVDVRRVPAARVVGGAVADLTHLVAELVENATVFSPPDARVTVRATPVDGRCVVEVEDAGLGMGPEALAEANARLADARASDMFDSDRLGLFVVSRLARRHGVQVLLSPVAGGGTLAQVWLPVAVLEPADDLDQQDQHDQRHHIDRHDRHEGPRRSDPADGLEDTDGRRRSAGSGEAAGPDLLDHAAPDGGSRTPDPAAAADGWGPDPRGNRQRVPITVGENGLPRRVRQSSLAPQLRGHRTATQVSGSGERRGADPRSPDEVRATMAAFQNGWTLGRASAEAAADDDPNDRRGSG